MTLDENSTTPGSMFKAGSWLDHCHVAHQEFFGWDWTAHHFVGQVGCHQRKRWVAFCSETMGRKWDRWQMMREHHANQGHPWPCLCRTCHGKDSRTGWDHPGTMTVTLPVLGRKKPTSTRNDSCYWTNQRIVMSHFCHQVRKAVRELGDVLYKKWLWCRDCGH